MEQEISCSLPNLRFLSSLNSTLKEEEIIQILKTPKSVYPCNITPDHSEIQLITKILIDNNQVESQQEKISKFNVHSKLSTIVGQWSMEIAQKEKHICVDQLEKCKAILLPYGSWVIGATSNSSDVDLVCLAPNFIDRKKHFFKGLYERLEQNGEVSQLNAIEQTENPIIKLKLNGYSVDINFAQLNLDHVPEPAHVDEMLDELRKNISSNDKQSLFAINGRKNGLLIFQSVKQQEVFILALRYIKLWAKKRQIASNILGYLGGISWAILISKICQMFPTLTGPQIIIMFFKVYSSWDWKNWPVSIDEETFWQEDAKKYEKLAEISWPKSQKQESDMSIITPAFPYINSAGKVNLLSLRNIKTEFERAINIIEQNPEDIWFQLIEEYVFFKEFDYLIEIDVVSNNKLHFHKWLGFCEAQIFKLINNIIKNLVESQPIIGQILDPLDDKQDKLLIRLMAGSIEDLDEEYQSSQSFFIGLKQIYPDEVVFLIQPVMYFCEKLLENKRNLKTFEESDNIKIFRTWSQEVYELMKERDQAQEKIVKKVKFEIMDKQYNQTLDNLF